MWISLLILIVILSTTITCLYILKKEADAVYSALNAFKTRAIIAEDDKELRDIEMSLRLYVEKKCWHKHYMSHASKVLSYIHGRQMRMKI